MFRARPKSSVRLKSRPKFNIRPITHHDPGNNVPRSAQPLAHDHAAHDNAARAGNNASRPRNLLAYHGRWSVRAGKLRPRPAEKHRPILHRPTTAADRNSGHDRSDHPRPDCPADRPDRPSERRGRPEAVFEAQSAQFKPKAGAD
ncbi:unnamed protein product [Microthlaspi erraticum]|uniref:Uncharacterized protein n=1 Tax=Microthlaspi erraticum TaxID=1685480 RepID=A0A6D2K6S0_9BRAS|nr:unnamed protein product [Microthlaspi erraticum]